MTRFTKLALAVCATVAATVGIALAAAPGATTTAASDIASTTATVNGTVSANNTDTSYYFQYGTTTAYGSQTPTQGPVKGNADRRVSADLTGLAPATTYNYRIVATNADGTVNGANMTFTTAPAYAIPGITIAASKRTVTFGRPTTISGTLTGAPNAGVAVTLEENPHPYTGGFKPTGLTATTDASGNYSVIVSPAKSTRYRVTARDKKDKVTSTEAAVRVRVKVTLRLSDRTPRIGQRVRFSGFVLPGHDGKVVRIQRRTAAGRWRTIATKTLVAAKPVGATTRSKYAKRLRIRKNGTYRARVAPGDGDHIAGNSRRKRAVVR